MRPAGRQLLGVSGEDRRLERRARLLEAALDLVGAEGIAHVTMTGVCNRAELSERYFYESFQNLDALLADLLGTLFGQIFADTLFAVDAAQADLYSRTRAAIEAFVQVVDQDPRKARLYLEAKAASGAALRRRRAEGVQTYVDFVITQFGGAHDAHGHDHRARLHLAAVVLVGGQADVVSGWVERGVALSRDEYVDSCARMCVAAVEALRARPEPIHRKPAINGPHLSPVRRAT